MSTSYFIGPIDIAVWKDAPDDAKPTSNLRIDPAAYEQALVARWPQIGIARQAMSHCVLYWEVPAESAEHADMAGQLFNDHQMVSFVAGSKRTVADFVLWHRAFVPPQYRLSLFNPAGWDRLELTPETSAQAILAFTSSDA